MHYRKMYKNNLLDTEKRIQMKLEEKYIVDQKSQKDLISSLQIEIDQIKKERQTQQEAINK